MAYGKILVDEVENSNGDKFDLSHASLTGTSDAGSHPASAISTDSGLSVEEKIGEKAFVALSTISELKALDSSLLVDGYLFKVVGYDSQTDYSVDTDMSAGFYMWSTSYTPSDCDGVNLIDHSTDTSGAFQLVEHKNPYYKVFKNVDCVPQGASSVVSGDVETGGWGYLKLNGRGVASSVAGYNYAWGADSTGEEYIDLKLPYGVVIGDSIAEGRPMQDGRLGGGTYDPDLENTAGCPSVEMAKRTGCYWYNHGWRGQKAGEVAARWPRDVLGETYDVGDGIGDQTLPVGTKPYAVWVNVGINDNWNGNEVNEIDIKNNYIYMAESARENGIVCIFNTIGPNGTDVDSLGYEKQIQLNAWLKSEMPKRGAYVFDYREWFVASDGISMNGTLGYDTIHPAKRGHISMAQELLKQTKAPIVLNSLVIESRVDPENTPPAIDELTGVKIENVDTGVSQQVSLRDGVGVISRLGYPTTKDSIIRVNPNEFNGSESEADGWSVISAASCVFGAYAPEEYRGDFDSNVADSIALTYTGTPSLSIPFKDSGRLEYGVGTEYVSGLPICGVDFTRSTSIDLLQVDGTFKTFAVDEAGISFEGIALHGALTNIITNNSDMTDSSWVETESTVTLNGSDYGLNLYDLVGTTAESSHHTTVTASTSGGTRFTVFLYAKKTSDYQLTVVVRNSSYSNRAVVNYRLDGSGDVDEYEAENLTIVNADSKSSGGLVWVKLEVDFDTEIDTSSLALVIGASDLTGDRDIAGDGVSSMITFGGVNLFEDYINIPVNITTTGSSSTIGAANASLPCQGNISMPSDFAIVVDVPRRSYGRILTIDSVLYILLERYANGGGGISINGTYTYNTVLSESEDNMRLTIVFDYSQSAPLLYIDGVKYTGPSVDMDTLKITSALSTIYIGRNSSSGARLQSSIKRLLLLPYAPSANEIASWGKPK